MSVIYNGSRSYDSQPPHAVAVLVTPAVEIVASTIANPTVLETATPHSLVSGDTVLVAGHTGSTPAVDGSRIVTVIDALHVSVPVNVTVAGAGGTVTRTLAVEPLTLAEARSHLQMDPAIVDQDANILRWIIAAREWVEQETGISLLLKTYDVYFDALPMDRTPIALPWRPVPSIASFSSIDSAGVTQTLAVTNYHLDPSSAAPRPARVALSEIGAWPTDLRSFQPYVLRIVAGFASPEAVPEPLRQWMRETVAAFYVGREPREENRVPGYVSSYIPVCVA